MTQYEIPYVCPECDHDRWVVANPEDPSSQNLKCPKCGFEDNLELPTEVREVGGLDGLVDAIDELRDT